MSIRGIRTCLADDAGGSSLDMALSLPFYILMILGIFAIAFVLWTENGIQHGASAAARCAVVDTTECNTVGAVRNAAIGWSYGVLSSSDAGKVTVNLSANCSPGQSGKAVLIQYPVNFFVISTTVAAEACFPDLS
jgi:Flp pilus assembly protein TadG